MASIPVYTSASGKEIWAINLGLFVDALTKVEIL